MMFLTMTFFSMFLTAENDPLFLKFSGRLVFVSSFLTRVDYVSYKLFLIIHNVCTPYLVQS